jgi:hypothetical protein
VSIPQGQSTSVGREFINLAPVVIDAILRSVAMGWEIAVQRAEVTSDADEVAITECLRDAMRDVLKGKGASWGKTLVVLPGAESRSQSGMTAPDGRTDIPLLSVTIFSKVQEHDPHAIIECKRVTEEDSHLLREYVNEGIDRFTSGKYSANHSHGFMVGYVLSGTCDGVVAGVNSYLGKQARPAEHLMPMHGGADCDGWSSCHPRLTEPRQIVLYHAMVRVN